MVQDSFIEDDDDVTDEIREQRVGTIPYFLVIIYKAWRNKELLNIDFNDAH